MKALIVLPTYNEGDNIEGILERVLAHGLFEVLVVDDNSTDGTREKVRQWANREDRVSLIERPGKMGLGTAYITGFKWGLDRGYECIMEMDSDFSHDPSILPEFYHEMENGNDLVIGSRYIGGTISVVGWDFKRLLLSRFGNEYARRILGLTLTDMTSGYRAFSSRALRTIQLDKVHSTGYAFQIEMAYYIWSAGLNIKELPIIFTERAEGSSKMSESIVREAIRLPWRLRFQRMFNRLAINKSITGGER